MNGKYKKLSQGFLVALLFAFTAVLVAPLNVQITNQLEFSFNSTDLVTTLLPAFAICLLGLTALLSLLQGKTYRITLSIIFILSLLLWLQGNLLLWDYGALDGREIDWLGMWPFGLLDAALWTTGIGLAVRYSSWLVRNLVGVASIFLIMIQCISLYSGISTNVPIGRYKLDSSAKFAFSSQKNVIVIVVDSFQTDVFQEVIDEEPDLKAVFDDFVYFRNAVSGFRQSYPSVPNILTGTFFDNSQPMWDYVREAYLGDSSLPKFFKEHGYKSEVYEHKAGMFFDPSVVTNTRLSADFRQASPNVLLNIDITLFRYLPHFLKMRVYNNQLWLLSRWGSLEKPDKDQPRMVADVSVKTRQNYVDLRARPARQDFTQKDMSKLTNLKYVYMFANHSYIGYEEPVFKFYHLHGTHLPIRMNRNFQYVEPRRSRQALKELSIGVIGLIDIMINAFRELGIYDDALIVVTADHGLWTKVSAVKIPGYLVAKYGGNGSRTKDLLPEQKGTVLPLVMIKRINAKGPMLTNDAPVALSDIPRTVVAEMGFDASSFPGESMFDLQENQDRQRLVYYSTFKANPAYSEPYRSTMTEFKVNGFSWLDKSWSKTGKTFPPPDSIPE